ncbi:MAG: hypothetical protein WDZ64_01080 [Parcubacteria group bacterium]
MADKNDVTIDKKNFVEEMTFLLVGILFVGYVFMRFEEIFGGLEEFGSRWESIRDYFLANIWPVWQIVALLISVLAVYWIINNMRKLRAIEISENKIYNPDLPQILPVGGVSTENVNEKWEKVLGHAHSDNPSEWRLAILEADIMLDELLRSKGHVGESIGDMLKEVDRSDLLTLDNAWEAHKVRNRIAHDGSNFQLNEREKDRVISLFESVFKEFEVI